MSVVSLGKMLFQEENQRQADRQRLLSLSNHIATILAQRFTIIEALAEDPHVHDLLGGRAAQDNDRIRLVFNTANALARSELIWVMNRQGMVQSSSDYQDSTLTGNDYSFRPYFKGAMQGEEVVFPAVGATTKTRGFYLSTPVLGEAGRPPLGVVALKIPMTEIDLALAGESGEVFLASPDGVVFASNREQWLFRTLAPLSEQARERLAETRQFGDVEPTPLGLDLRGDVVLFSGEEHEVLRQPLAVPGWSLISLQPRRPLPPLTRVQKGLLVTAGAVVTGLSVLVLFLFRNIGLRRETEIGLRRAEEKYRSIFENATEGIFQTTLQGEFLNASPSMARILGYDSVQELMAGVQDLATQTYMNPEERQSLLQEVKEQGRVREFVTALRRKDGRGIWVSLSARAVRDEKGAIRCLEGFCMDDTKRKNAESDLADLNKELERLVEERTRDLDAKARELEVANQKLMELDALKSSFLTTVSHDLRTPLTSILGFAKLIRKDFARHFLTKGDGEEKSARHGQRILANLMIIGREGERLTRLVNDFLDLSRIESGQVAWYDGEVAPELIVDEAVDAVRGQFAGNPRVNLVVEKEPDLPRVRVDPDRIARVLVNLLNNAAKYTAKGTVAVKAHAEDGRVLISVTDTGCGIPLSEQGKIFDKFHKVRSGDTVSGKPQGTGLGLAICKDIVTHYGGEIWVESSPGQGCAFSFTLPCA